MFNLKDIHNEIQDCLKHLMKTFELGNSIFVCINPADSYLSGFLKHSCSIKTGNIPVGKEDKGYGEIYQNKLMYIA